MAAGTATPAASEHPEPQERGALHESAQPRQAMAQTVLSKQDRSPAVQDRRNGTEPPTGEHLYGSNGAHCRPRQAIAGSGRAAQMRAGSILPPVSDSLCMKLANNHEDYLCLSQDLSDILIMLLSLSIRV
jgi:hypothetical protein